jgi:hypothetical protein
LAQSRQGKIEGNDPGIARGGLELSADRARSGVALDKGRADCAVNEINMSKVEMGTNT